MRLAIIASGWALFFAWALRYLPQGPSFNQPHTVSSLSVQFNWLQLSLGAALLILGLVAQLRGKIDLRRTSEALLLCLLAALSPLWMGFGYILLILALSFVVAILLSVQFEMGWQREIRVPDWLCGILLFVGCFSLHATFSIHRHISFGTGAWDMGCMVHNFYLSSRGLPTISTVLGGVDFLGDHFMPGIYLFAPLFWLNTSGSMVLLIQSASLAAAAPAIFAIARKYEASVSLATSLGLVTGLSYGFQSGAYFDAHGITVGFAFLALALWLLEKKAFGWASVSLFAFSLFKESVGPYIVGLGLFLLLEATRHKDRRMTGFAAAWIVYGTLCFLAVTRVFMPWFEARGLPSADHETFADFGPTVFAAFFGVLRDPLKAVGAIFIPREKLLSLAVTIAGSGALALVSWEVVVAALPLLAERFLSSNASMWHMGYHYAAPLCLYVGWAAARSIPRLEKPVRTVLSRVADVNLINHWQRTLTIYLLVSGFLVCRFGYLHPSNYFVWNAHYFSRGAKRMANRSAVDFVRSLGRDVSVAAQNRLLPHVADRAQIWRLGEYMKADVVILSTDESAWPYGGHYPSQVAQALRSSAEHRTAFDQGNTQVFVRVGVDLDQP